MNNITKFILLFTILSQEAETVTYRIDDYICNLKHSFKLGRCFFEGTYMGTNIKCPYLDCVVKNKEDPTSTKINEANESSETFDSLISTPTTTGSNTQTSKRPTKQIIATSKPSIVSPAPTSTLPTTVSIAPPPTRARAFKPSIVSPASSTLPKTVSTTPPLTTVTTSESTSPATLNNGLLGTTTVPTTKCTNPGTGNINTKINEGTMKAENVLHLTELSLMELCTLVITENQTTKKLKSDKTNTSQTLSSIPEANHDFEPSSQPRKQRKSRSSDVDETGFAMNCGNMTCNLILYYAKVCITYVNCDIATMSCHPEECKTAVIHFGTCVRRHCISNSPDLVLPVWAIVILTVGAFFFLGAGIFTLLYIKKRSSQLQPIELPDSPQFFSTGFSDTSEDTVVLNTEDTPLRPIIRRQQTYRTGMGNENQAFVDVELHSV